MKVIALSGPKGSGKSEVVKGIRMVAVSRLGVRSQNFADPLKEMLLCLMRRYGYSEQFAKDCLWGSMKEEHLNIWQNKSTRYAMQTLGTEWGRDLLGENFWVNIWSAGCKRHPSDLILVEDLRFMNEYRAIKQLNGIIIRVTRPGFEGDSHRSETEARFFEADHVITNDGSLLQLHVRVEALAERLLAA